MIVGFSKLFSDIIHSTVWREEMHVKVVWVTMLAMADRHGQVMASVPGLADAAKVTLDQCLDALQKFQSPDEYSRTKDYDGRRIMEIDGGWLLFNYEKFRDRKDDEEQRIKTRERVRKFREKAKGVTESVTVTPGNDIQKQKQITDTEAEFAAVATKPKKPKQTDEEWLSELQDNPAYQPLNVRNEFARAQVWADTNNRQCTRRFFVNWLNRAKPITGVQNGTNKSQSFQDRRAELARESYKRESEIRERVAARDRELSEQVISDSSRQLSPVEPNAD